MLIADIFVWTYLYIFSAEFLYRKILRPSSSFAPIGPSCLLKIQILKAGIPDIEDHGAIQYELMHMEEQLANLDYNIEDLDEEFIKMDEEIALTFSQNDLDDQEEVDPFQDILAESSEAFTGADNILGAVAAAPNPFDAWEREASSAIPELLQLDNILAEPLYNSQVIRIDVIQLSGNKMHW